MYEYVSSRCRKLPKGLKEWPAFNTLKKTIDDFNDMCPLLELMSNKAMKPRHWQRIAEVISRPLEVDSENFCLRNIMDTPLLQFKEDIEVSKGDKKELGKFVVLSFLLF